MCHSVSQSLLALTLSLSGPPLSPLCPRVDCSRNFTIPSGIIESPGFPDKYPHNLECSFIIIVPPSMDVTLTFLTFDLENDPLPGGEGDCKYDWLEVWDGLPQGKSAPALVSSPSPNPSPSLSSEVLVL